MNQERRQVAIDHMRAMENEMKIAQDQISARREEHERSVQSVRRLYSLMSHFFLLFFMPPRHVVC